MQPRSRRAGGAAAVLLLALALATAAPASAQTGTSPTLEGLCWMGPNRPVVRAGNHDPRSGIAYTLRSGSATRSGNLAPLAVADPAPSTAYFVATGSFPTANRTVLDGRLGGTPVSLATVDTQGQYCTYGLRPELRWLDAAGRPVASPTDAPGLVLIVSGPLEQLTCSWRSGALDCLQQTSVGSPLVPGSYPASTSQLQVPAFSARGRAPAYRVQLTPPPGYRAVAGTGAFALDDLGAGLGQGNVDARLGPFLAGGRDRTMTVTLRPADSPAAPETAAPPTTAVVPTAAPPPTVAGTSQVVPQAPAVPAVTPPAVAPPAVTPPAAVPAATLPGGVAAPLPRTGPGRPLLAAAGALAALVGAGLVLAGRRSGRRPA